MEREPTVAMVLVVRNEERFLADHLAYHRALGVGRVYAYLDRCTDATPAILEASDDAEVIQRDRSGAHRHMSAHQTDCLADALKRARRDGVDWLLHLDPDEFARCERPGEKLAGMFERAAGSLRGRLGGPLRSLGQAAEQVTLRTVEAVPTPLGPGQGFRALRWFQDGGALTREILDPTNGAMRTLDHLLGNSRGKSAVRVGAAVEPASAHHWERVGGGLLPTVRAGSHLHYVVTDRLHWQEKYAKFSEYPAHWEKGKPVRFPKQAWKEASVTMSDDEAEAYFDQWVAVDAADLERLAATPAGRFLRCDQSVDQVLRSLVGR